MLKIEKYTYGEVMRRTLEAYGDDYVVYIDEKGSMKLGELMGHTDSLAACLIRDHGLKQGGRVTVIGNNTIDWFISFYAIIRAGCVAVIVNPRLSIEEIKRHCEASESELILLTGAGVDYDDELTAAFGDKVIIPDRVPPHLVTEEELQMLDDIEKDFPPRGDAIAFFTSGSTSKPKVALLPQEALVYNTCRFTERNYPHGEYIPTTLPVYHVMGQQQNLLYMMAGITMVLGDNKIDTIVEICRKYPVREMGNVSTIFIMLMRHPDFDSVVKPNLDYIIIGGGSASPEQIGELEERYDAIVAKGYGLTEAGCTVTINAFDAPREKRYYTSGNALDGVDLKIGNLSEKEGSSPFCPTGEVGEVLVGGDSLMNGYAEDAGEEVTIDERGYLHTGDLAYLDEDGYLYICGRKKSIIVKGGENILPSEVESCISAMDCVDAVIVLGVPDEKYGEEVGAFVVPKKGFTVTFEDIQAAVCEKLTRFKQPRYLYLYDRFPLNDTGKPDLVKLKADASEKRV